MNELWVDIDGYKGLYKVSNLGRIKSIISDKILKNIKTGNGYLKVSLYSNDRTEQKSIHRLVCENFLEPDIDRKYVNHIDGDKLNNNITNLEWCTSKENNDHRYTLGYKITDEMRINMKNAQQKRSRHNRDNGIKNPLKGTNFLNKFSMTVQQLSLDGELVAEFKSLSIAGKSTSISTSNITSVCYGLRRKAGGYSWRFKDNKMQQLKIT